MALEIPSVSETVEEPADFQGWTSAFNAIDERYDAEQLEISDAFAMDSLAIEQDIEAEKNRILTDLNESLQQQLMKMHKAIEESIDRQVKGRLRLEQRKRDHATKKAALDKCRLAEIRSLYDENRTRTLQVTEQNTTQRRAIKDHISLENKGSSLLRHPTPPNGESTPSGSNRLREDGQDFASSRISSEGSDEDEDDDGMSSSSQRPSVSGARSPLPSSNTLSFGSAARSPTSGPEPAMSSKTSDHAIDSVQPALGSSLDLAHPLKRKVDEMATTVTDPVKRTRKRTSRCSSLKSSNSKRTISFDEVFQEGSAQYKHMIIEYPPGEGQFYILKCDEHHVHFGLNPLHGAAKHLSSAQHRNQPKMHSLAIETLGHYVFDCDQHLAEKNNAVVKRAFKEGYEPFNANRLTKGERISQGYEALHSLSIQTTPSRHSEKGPHKPVGNNSKPFMGIANPVAGELYLGYWSKTKTKYPVIVLPWGDLRVAGIPATLSQTSLKNNIPRCYIVDRMTQNIKGWAKAYEDDGSLVHKREFPVYYFDRNRSVGWLAAKYLSEFNMEDPKSNQYPAYNDARDHYSRARGYKDYLDWKEKNGVRGSTRASHSDQTTSGVLTAPATKATCPASASMIASSNEAVGDEPRGSMHPIADVDLAVEPNNAYAEQGVETVNTGHLPKDAYTGLHVVRSPSPVPAAQAQAADGHQNAGVKPKFIPTNASKSPANGHVVAPLAHELHAPVDAEIQHPYLGQMQPASVGASSAPGISLANQVVPASAPLASNNTPQTAQQIARTVLQMSPMQKNGVVNDHGNGNFGSSSTIAPTLHPATYAAVVDHYCGGSTGDFTSIGVAKCLFPTEEHIFNTWPASI
ncbi:hypothetical protein NKR23_g7191 [Pleurostoma richardsiae]|uniref:Uncharacterized protein n=1 Tax=Pleurostoma richardsiae TaxID=41990 RepID=A0AA38RNF1_9PEZI|nr:hypothetical protein NKR23_g7191 [Pleurostoma richardsiae]